MRRIRIGATCAVLLVPAVSVAQQAPRDHLLKNGAVAGSAIGAAAAVTFASLQTSWCGVGCENDMPGVALLMVAGTGAAIGAAVGWIADRDAARIAGTGRRWHVRLGPTASQAWYREPGLDGTFPTRGASLTLEASPHVRFQTEYLHAGADLMPPQGQVPASILDHVVPAANRNAGYSRAIFSRRLGGALAETIGVRLPVPKVGIELVGGILGQQIERRDYYDAGSGQYKVLNFQSPFLRWIYGADLTIPVARHIVISPGIRATSGGESRAVRAGLGVQYRF